MKRKDLFLETENYEELKKLLSEGYNYSSIARYFGCNHSTVIYHANKLGEIKGKRGKTLLKKPKFGSIPINPKRSSHKFTPLEDYILGEKINTGKNYADYLRGDSAKKGKEIKLAEDRNRFVDLPGTFIIP